MEISEEKAWQQFEAATGYRDRDEYKAALDLLLPLREVLVHPSYLAVLGQVLWKLEQLDEASTIFREGTELRPKSALLSLGLFHTLWEMNEHDAAFDEMRRFLSIAQSEEYNRLLADMSKAVGGEPD